MSAEADGPTLLALARGAIAANLGWEMSAEKATVARDVQPLALPK